MSQPGEAYDGWIAWSVRPIPGESGRVSQGREWSVKVSRCCRGNGGRESTRRITLRKRVVKSVVKYVGALEEVLPESPKPYSAPTFVFTTPLDCKNIMFYWDFGAGERN